MRVRILWEVIQIGNLIASPVTRMEDADDGYMRGTITYAWWYRPVVALAFWLCAPKEDG